MKPEILSLHRRYKRSYTPEELLGEIKNLIESGDYEDFMFIADGSRRSIRVGSTDQNLRMGDLLFLNELIKADIMEMT